MEAVGGEVSEGVSGTVVEGPESPGAVEAVGVGSEGVKGKVVVEGSIAVVEGGEGPQESVKSQPLVNSMTVMTGMTASQYDRMIFFRNTSRPIEPKYHPKLLRTSPEGTNNFLQKVEGTSCQK